MIDRLIASSLNTTILALVFLTAAAAVFLGYVGLVDLFNGQANSGTCALFTAFAPAIASLKLCWYRNDLVDR